MTFGMPGPGGSLGTCAVCGESFVKETLFGDSVHRFGVEGIAEEMFAHDACMRTLEQLRGGHYSALPDGPLRRAFEKADTDDLQTEPSR